MPRHNRTFRSQTRAKRLRKAMTPSELVLWQRLRGGRLGVRFRRQEPIGPYIVDFVARECGLVVEADGDHHEFSKTDARRDRYLRKRGFRVLRFWNEDIARHPDWVVDEIRKAISHQQR